MELQKYRDALIDRAAAAFSRDVLDEASFEVLVARIQTAGGEAELRAAEAELAPLSCQPGDGNSDAALAGRSGYDRAACRGSPEVMRTFSLNMSNLIRSGDWVDAIAYRLEGRMSNFTFDFGSYAQERNFILRFDVDLSMSNLVLRLPADWQVDCRIGRNTASTVKDRGPRPTRGSCRILVEGALSMSTIKVKRYGGGGGLWSALFGGQR